MLVINAFDGLGYVNIIEYAQDGAAISLAAKGFISATFEAGGKAVDCEISGSRISFKAGKLGIRPGIYQAKIVGIKADNPDGEPLAGPGEPIEIELQYHA